MDFRQQLDDIRAAAVSVDEPTRLRSFFETTWAQELAEAPEMATFYGIRGHDHRWSELTVDAVERRVGERREALEVLDTIDGSTLSEQERLSLDLFRTMERGEIEGADFHGELQPVNQLQGVQQDAAMVIEAQPSETGEDVAAVLERLRALPALVDQTIELMRLGAAAGNTPPQICLRDVPQQVRNQLVADPFDSPLLRTIAGLHDDGGRKEAAQAYRQGIVPAFERLHDFLVEDYLPRARTTTACRDLPNGEAWYRYLVRHHTTTDHSPEEIHELGLAEVARIKAEMARVAESAGAADLGAYAHHLRTDPTYACETADALLEGYRAIGRHIDARLPDLFGTLPELAYEIVPVPSYAEQSQTAAYYLPGATDGSRPGQFFANTYDLASRFTWEMESLTLHEAVPGHHLQIALAQELGDLPDFRRNAWFTAYGEGWGLYAESLGAELGLYATPAARYGALMGEIWRAVRLVLDTGLHAFGWSRDQAIAYFQEATGRDDHDIVVEVDRYIVWPGQALGYKMGELKIKELRERATGALGGRFDLRAFHDEVLRHGCLPLGLLEAKVDGRIAASRPGR